MSKPVKTKGPLLLAFAFVLAGILVSVVIGGTTAFVVGGVIAACGAAPALYGAWKGMQAETQGGLAGALFLTILALASAAVLVVIGLVGWLRA